MERGMAELFGTIEMFCVLIIVVVTEMYTLL